MVYWAVEQLVADCAACSRLVMKDITTKAVELSHLPKSKKNWLTPSLILAAVAQTKVMRAIRQSGPQEERGVESVGEDSIFGESPVGEDSIFGESQGSDSTFRRLFTTSNQSTDSQTS